MATRMQQRRGTAEQWTNANPVLAAGEIGFESDTGFFKMGDGVNAWADLSYFETSDTFAASLGDYIELDEKGAANGVAELDANGQVPASQLGNATVDLSAYATESYVDTAVSGLVDSAPGLLDTLNELAAAIGDDANFVTTINTSVTDGDAATLAAAEDYTDNALANFTTLPDQTGNAGEYLTTDGTNASWSPLTLDKAIDDLTDVAITSPSNGQALVYSAVASRWENASVAPDLSAYATTQYVDDEIAAIPAPSLDDLTDVAVTNPSNGDALVYSQIANRWESAAIPAPDFTGYATEVYVNNAVAGLVDSAPGTLDTLNELAAALGDDTNFATTVTNAIAAIDGLPPLSEPSITTISDADLNYGVGASGVSEYFLGALRIELFSERPDLLSYVQSALPLGTTFVFEVTEPGFESTATYQVSGTITFEGFLLVIPATLISGSTSEFNGHFEFQIQGTVSNAGKYLTNDGTDASWEALPSELTYLDGVTSSIQTQLNAKADKLVSFVTKSGSATLALTDADKMVEVSAAATITVPTDASVAFPVGSTINITQTGTGTVTVVGASGVTVNFTPSNTLRTQWSSAVLVKRAANTWLLSGDLL